MWILTEEQEKELLQKANEYDFIRFTWPDFNGISRGRTAPGRNAARYITDGVWEFTGAISIGPRTELPEIEELTKSGFGNSRYVPASRLYDIPWAADGKYKVGQVICEAFWPDNRLLAPHPRSVARKQIERLDSMGYNIYSGFEAEFIIVDKETHEPMYKTADYLANAILNDHSSILYDAEKQLHKAGIDVGAIHLEFSPGQVEFCMSPKYGLQTADDMFVFKDGMREILSHHGLKPTFMTKPFNAPGCSSGFHYNHSLWDKHGKSAFFDDTKPDNMSDIMRYWIGGMMKHIKSVLALCSNTPNCYRRLHNILAPNQADWGIENRFAAIRVKNLNPESVLVENRLPGAACNAYLVMAATIAAGIDGIENQIEPPPAGQSENAPVLPSFEACLDDLEANDVMKAALSEEFVRWYLIEKRQCELAKLGKHDVGKCIEEEMEKEREEYFNLI